MKKTLLYLNIALFCFLGPSCDYERIRADDEITSRTVLLTDYTGLRVSGVFNVYITFSDTEEKIIIEANSNLHDVIEVAKKGGDLDIGLKKYTNIRGNVTLNAYITTKHVDDYDISGASRIHLVNDLEAENSIIKLTGASEFEGGINSGHLQLTASGASKIDLFGFIAQMDAELSGSSRLKDFDLSVNKLKLHLSGASDSYLKVNETIDYRGSGASSFYYKGDANINSIDVSGTSKIEHWD